MGRLMLVWAWLKLPLVLLSSSVGYRVERAQAEALAQVPPRPADPFIGMGETFATVGTVLWLLWGLGLVTFVLIWFSRPAVKQEVAGWR